MGDFMGFKLNAQQERLLAWLEKNPNKPLQRSFSGGPSYEMIQLAKYLKGDLGKKYKVDRIIFDEFQGVVGNVSPPKQVKPKSTEKTKS